MKLAFNALLTALLLFTYASKAQNTSNTFWTPVKESEVSLSGKRQIIPQKYLSFSIKSNLLKKVLFSAPHEKTTNIQASTCIIELPLPNGEIQKFKVIESPVMAEELGHAYPDIKTFSVKGIDDPYASGKLDWNNFGLHGMIFSPQGDYFIDPYCPGNMQDYLVYYSSDFIKESQYMIPEASVETEEGEKRFKFKDENKTGAKSRALSTPICVGDQLRTYKLAIACTGEYAIAATGTTTPSIAQTLAKIVTTVNRVDGVFEKEVAVRMVLVATQTNVIFTNPSTDPFNGNNNANTLISESQSVITNTIGTANFDIGHTFSTGGGGLAFLGVVCNATSKALGITGSGNPVGDPYDIDYVAHEIGHQFDSRHSFNAITGSCNGNRSASTAMEPGSGVTIMSYAGICSSNNITNNSIPYFHAVSYDEIVNFTQAGSGNACPVITSSGNQPPLVTGSGNYTIPYSTPFILTGSGIDPDGDPITYSWEETDAGLTGSNWNSGSAPFFRSYVPVMSATRFFPINSAVINSNYSGVPGEFLPQSMQTLNFRITTRDNKMGGGGVCYSSDVIKIDNSGPLTVTYPNATGIIWGNSQNRTITWDVNGTDQMPVNCFSVNILISYDGGSTYSLLKSSTDNDGFETIVVPTVTATINTCRIKVESKGNIFYDIGNNNFTISTDVTVGMQELSAINPVNLNVWPNPFNNTLNFTTSALNRLSNTYVKVIDLLGNTLQSVTYLNKKELKETLDLSIFSKGIYFLIVTNGDKQSVQKIVKE
jgi:hypothetical protein